MILGKNVSGSRRNPAYREVFYVRAKEVNWKGNDVIVTGDIYPFKHFPQRKRWKSFVQVAPLSEPLYGFTMELQSTGVYRVSQ